MGEASEMTLTFRCPRGLESVLPKPIPAVQGLPDWFKALSQRAFNPSMGGQSYTVKKCPPFVDAMTYGFLIPLASDLEVRDGEFSWNFEAPGGCRQRLLIFLADRFSRSEPDRRHAIFR